MKSKTIKKILSAKIDSWIQSIPEEEKKVRNAIRKSSIVTGGCIASMLLNEDINDFDIYFKNKKDLKTVARYYGQMHDILLIDGAENNKGIKTGNGVHLALDNMDETRIKFLTNGGGFKVDFDPEKIEKNSFLPTFFSPNAISFTDDLQVVLRFHGDIDEIHKNYDFVHATNAYDYEKNNLILRKDALESLLSKNLYYIGSKYPLTSIIRSKKFIKRGWNISAGQYLKIMYQISELDLKDPLVLEEQLTGVDIAYFEELIEAMRGVDEKKINYTYIGKIIDKIFE